jgi:hypothetical protein
VARGKEIGNIEVPAGDMVCKTTEEEVSLGFEILVVRLRLPRGGLWDQTLDPPAASHLFGGDPVSAIARYMFTVVSGNMLNIIAITMIG